MTPPSGIQSDGQPVSPARWRFLQRLVALSTKPTTHEYYVHWAEAWTKVRGNRSADATSAFFDALGRSTHVEDWQFRGERRRPAGCVWHPAEHSSARVQSVCASRPIRFSRSRGPPACDWRGLADQARSLEPDHRTLGRETIHVRAVLPSGCGVPPQAVPGASRPVLVPLISPRASHPQTTCPKPPDIRTRPKNIPAKSRLCTHTPVVIPPGYHPRRGYEYTLLDENRITQ